LQKGQVIFCLRPLDDSFSEGFESSKILLAAEGQELDLAVD
jgi:hypothetical protein